MIRSIQKRKGYIDMIRAIIKFVLKIVILILYRVKVIGKENIQPNKVSSLCLSTIACKTFS